MTNMIKFWNWAMGIMSNPWVWVALAKGMVIGGAITWFFMTYQIVLA